jgi:hypothetical protein
VLLFALLKESPTKTLFDSIVLYLIIQQRESLIKEILRQGQNFFDSLHWRATGALHTRAAWNGSTTKARPYALFAVSTKTTFGLRPSSSLSAKSA